MARNTVYHEAERCVWEGGWGKPAFNQPVRVVAGGYQCLACGRFWDMPRDEPLWDTTPERPTHADCAAACDVYGKEWPLPS